MSAVLTTCLFMMRFVLLCGAGSRHFYPHVGRWRKTIASCANIKVYDHRGVPTQNTANTSLLRVQFTYERRKSHLSVELWKTCVKLVAVHIL